MWRFNVSLEDRYLAFPSMRTTRKVTFGGRTSGSTGNRTASSPSDVPNGGLDALGAQMTLDSVHNQTGTMDRPWHSFG